MKVIILNNILIAVTFLLFSQFCLADSSEDCTNQSRAITQQIYARLFPEMSMEERSQLLQIANDVCMEYTNKTESKPVAQVAKQTNEVVEEKQSKMDWLTEKVLNSDSNRKAGNKRLQRKK